jgi:NTP-dependent ternary system trypsin peptidase co-occuring protein
MAKSLMAIPLDDAGLEHVLVEVEPSDVGLAPAGAEKADALVERVGGSVESSLRTMVVPTAKVLRDQLRELRPDEVEVEFGLSLVGKVGAVIASSELEAHMKVTLRWTQPAD